MDKDLKPPYVPPKEKILSEKELQKLETQGKKVMEEIQV